MKVRKALIPAAGHGTRLLPATRCIKKEMLPVVDEDGIIKPVIQFNVEEADRSGIDDICIIVQPDSLDIFKEYFSSPEDKLKNIIRGKKELEIIFENIARLGKKLSFVTQDKQEGYGHAVYCAKDWAGNEPFLLMLGDHIFKSDIELTCSSQLISAFENVGRSISAVNQVGENALPYFGTIAGEFTDDKKTIIRVDEIVEKPDAGYARRKLRVQGIPDGKFLCWFGMHLLTPGIFDALEYNIKHEVRERGEFQLTGAQELLRRNEGHYACIMQGRRYDMGMPAEYKNTVAGLGPDI